MRQTSSLLTYDDYLTLPDDGKRYEIIEGELLMTPAPSLDHQRAVGRLYSVLREFVEKNKLGEVIISPIDVVLSMTDIVQPDIVFVSGNRSRILAKKNIVAAPDLVVEVLSESSEKTDRTSKKDLYERFGVREFWVVDVEKKSIEVYILSDERYKAPEVFSVAQNLNSALLRGLSFQIAGVFGS